MGDMDDDFGNTYHLLERNCNHFVERCTSSSQEMPPGWINRLRTAVVANSCAPCILPVSIRAVADTPSVPPPPSAAQYTMKTGGGGIFGGSQGAGAGGSTDFPTRRTRTTTLRCCRVYRRKGRPCGETESAALTPTCWLYCRSRLLC